MTVWATVSIVTGEHCDQPQPERPVWSKTMFHCEYTETPLSKKLRMIESWDWPHAHELLFVPGPVPQLDPLPPPQGVSVSQSLRVAPALVLRMAGIIPTPAYCSPIPDRYFAASGSESVGAT